MTLTNAIKKLKRYGVAVRFTEERYNKCIEGEYRGFAVRFCTQPERGIDTIVSCSYKFPGVPENKEPDDYTPWNYCDNVKRILDRIDFHCRTGRHPA